MRLEPTRISEYLINGTPPTGQSIRWLAHTSNTHPAAVTPELQQKVDVGPVLQAKETEFSTVAGLARVSRQMFDDFSDVAGFLPVELYKAVVLEENNQILNGDGTGDNQLGLFNTPGALTETFTAGGPDTQIDALVEAANKIRVGGAYADADLIILHPTDWTAIRRLKTTLGSYILDPNDPNTLGGVDNIFGIRVITTTQCPAGQAVVLDSKIAVTVWFRLGMEILSNPFGSGFETNEWVYRGEERFGLGVQYENALCLVDGLDDT
jgi:HK97 family phage major capsid protein